MGHLGQAQERPSPACEEHPHHGARMRPTEETGEGTEERRERGALAPAQGDPFHPLWSPRQSTIVKDAMVSHGVQSETVNLYDEAGPASDEASGAAAEEGGEEAAQVSNNDIRNMLLPFIRKPAPAVEEGADDGGRKRRKKKRKGADDDSSDDEREPPPPISLDKLGPVCAHALHTCTPHMHAHGATTRCPRYAHMHGAQA